MATQIDSTTIITRLATRIADLEIQHAIDQETIHQLTEQNNTGEDD
ncbi:hypothetical protein [Bifidobacterium vansinderenii]|uniref:Uncharacterized protein n=1 Tax=Bifidobacterium vansinderenii TaxID=1984871 RepID=A0A229W1F9_9BIFI|nr:hypothetical protein [Bifidobacterium vansinderenii]OXN01666.1 hypothetical protein Tam10B_0108 [Bifidobacterium vansinderenii]